MTARNCPSPGRCPLLVCVSLALVAGWLLSPRSEAVPPPLYTRNTAVMLLTVADLKPLHNLVARSSRLDMPVRTPIFSADGQFVGCAGGPTLAGTWEVASGKQVARIAGGCYALTFRPTGAVVAADRNGLGFTHPADHGLCLEWSQARGEATTLFRYRLEQPTFSPDGRFLAGRRMPTKTDQKWGIQMVTVPDGKEYAILPDDNSLLAVLPGANQVVSGKWPKKLGEPWTIRLWDVKTGKVVAAVEGLPLELGSQHTRVAVAPDGKKIALLALGAAEVLIWDPAAGTRTMLRHGHAELSAVGFSPDGKNLATAGPTSRQNRTYGIANSQVQQRVTVWDLATSRQIASAEVGNVRFGWLTFAPDGQHLLAAGSEDVMADGPRPPVPGR